eukprot:scaffold97030_cov40-Cyclotella_meneghiniana.AAC.1
MACLNQGLPIVETVAVERRAGASFLACDCSRKQAGATLSKLGGSRSQAVGLLRCEIIEGFCHTTPVAPQKLVGTGSSRGGRRQSSNSVTPATVRHGQSGVTFTGRLPVNRHAGGRFFDD